MKSRPTLTAEVAEQLAIQALTFIAAEPERLGRFLALSGIGPNEIRAAAREPGFLAGVLDYISSDDELLVGFAADAAVDPAIVSRARAALGSGDWEREMP